MIEKMYDSKIDKIIQDENPVAILLVGSASNTAKKDFERLRDIDIFVIIDNNTFYREVINIEGIDFDISYLPISLMKKAIYDRLPSLINVLHNSKVIYCSNTIIHDYLDDIGKVYFEGPKHLEDNEIRYNRFRLCQMYETILNKKSDELNIPFFLNNFIKELIYSYFKLNRIWIPPDKKILQALEKIDIVLYHLVISYYKTYDIDDKLNISNDILDYVIEPFGGVLKQWEKAEYPFDFT